MNIQYIRSPMSALGSELLQRPAPATQAERWATELGRLNQAQRDAVTHAAPEPLLVIAGAGSGKTSTLAHRVAHLIAQGGDPQRLLLLTFSRRAAQ